MDQQSRVPKARGQQSAKDLGTAWSLTFNKKPTRPAAAPEHSSTTQTNISDMPQTDTKPHNIPT